jgi:hypothetical protein
LSLPNLLEKPPARITADFFTVIASKSKSLAY